MRVYLIEWVDMMAAYTNSQGDYSIIEVAEYKIPTWEYDKILCIEKEGSYR